VACILGGACVVLSLYVRAALLLGRWPEVSRDDPKTFGFGVHYQAAGVGVGLWMASTVALLLVVALVAARKPGGAGLRPYLYVALLSAVLWMAPPWVSWYLD
jgi:hypothetical protein